MKYTCQGSLEKAVWYPSLEKLALEAVGDDGEMHMKFCEKKRRW